MDNKYDVAFSCAEEDLLVAEQLAVSLKKLGISYYLYTEHQAIHWGEDIFQISLDKYGVESRFVLMIISANYVKKHWSDIKRQVAQTVERIGEAYILPLRLDDTAVDGLGKNITYVRWNNDPDRIATLIAEKLLIKEEDINKQHLNQPQSVTTITGEKINVVQGNVDKLDITF